MAEKEKRLMAITYMPHDFRPITDKHVIFSSDDNPNYFFLLPIAALAWKKLEYRPVITLVCDAIVSHNDLLRFVISKCCEFGTTVQLIDSNIIKNDKRFDGYNLSMLAQISRFCSSSSSFFYSPEDYFLTSDADMIPVNKDWFHQQNEKEIHLFYANGYHHKRYPVCYCGMKVKTWEELFGLEGLDIYSALYKLLENLKPFSLDENQWGYDETLFYNCIKKYKNYPNNCQMIDRKIYVNPMFKGQPRTPRLLPYGRLDRSNFSFDKTRLDENGWVDIHCMRSPWIRSNWNLIRSALSKLVFDKDEMELIDNYYKDFIKHV